MIQSLRNIKNRIRAIENTKKITRAMEMVSASKLSKVKSLLYPARQYFAGLESIVSDLLSGSDKINHPLLEKRDTVHMTALCVITSDSGLCGYYNHIVIKEAESFINSHGSDNVLLIAIGKEGFNYFKKKRFNVINGYLDLHGKFSGILSEAVSKELKDIFLEKRADEVFVIYNRFDTMLRYRTITEKMFEMEYKKTHETKFLSEPDIAAVAERLVVKYVSEKMRLILLNAFTAEHSARIVAMKSATDNAKEIIELLTLQRNKARQSAITKEVLEIVSAAEALKG